MPSHGDDEEMIAASPEKPIKVVLETEPPARKPGRPRLDISAHFQDTGEMANHSHRFVWCIGCIKSGRPLFKRDRLPARGDLMQRHLQNCRYVSDEVRQKFKGSPRSSSASSAGDSKARKARIANIISEQIPLHGGASSSTSTSTSNNSGAAGPLVAAGPRLPPITTISSSIERSKLTAVISRPASGTGASAPAVTAAPASSEQLPMPMPVPVPLPMPISMPLRPPYSLSRPSSGGNDNQLPRIRSPTMRTSTPIDLPSISRRSHPYLNRERHPSSASLRGSQTPKTPVPSPPSPQHSQAQSRAQPQSQSTGQGLGQHHLHYHHHYHQQNTRPMYSASPIQSHIDDHGQKRRGPHSSPSPSSSAASSIGMSEPPAPISGTRVSPLSLSSSSHPGARRTDAASNSGFQTPLPSTAIVTPVNGLRGKLQAGNPVFGIVLSIPSPMTARLASRLGYDWACIDMEHSAHSASIMAEMVAAISSSGTCTPVVRVPSHSGEWIKWAVDAGAQGIIVPGVQSREQMQHLVSVCRNATAFAQKYPRHSSPGSHAYHHNRHSYQSMQPHPQPPPAYHAESAAASGIVADVMVIPQIDRPEAIGDIDGILSVPGVDAAFVRPQALVNELAPILPPLRTIEPHRSLGILGANEDSVARVLRSGRHYAVPLGIDSLDGSSSGIRARVHQGFQLVTVASDIDALASAAADQLRMARTI